MREIPLAEVGHTEIGDGMCAADQVCFLSNCEDLSPHSDDLLIIGYAEREAIRIADYLAAMWQRTADET